MLQLHEDIISSLGHSYAVPGWVPVFISWEVRQGLSLTKRRRARRNRERERVPPPFPVQIKFG
jgi:hypothetical protein